MRVYGPSGEYLYDEPVVKAQQLVAVQSVGGGGWMQIIRESFAGAFSRHVTIDGTRDVLSFSGVFAPVTLIAGDIGKLRVKLVEEDEDGICTELEYTSPFWTTLRKPNHYQNRVQFWLQWILSKLLWGNTYALKVRESARGMVKALYILDPARVKPLVATTGDVYYELSPDHLSGLINTVTVPASEIIHDRWNCLWHPLCGVSPIFACALSATQGRRIQNNSTSFFENASRPSGILVAPGSISDQDAAAMKERWEQNYGAGNAGRTAVLGNGLKYEAMSQPAEQSQLIEQLGWTKFDCADCFHVPHFKVGGAVPAGSSIEALNLQYYTDCLQTLIESAEICLDEGLELKDNYYTEFDLDGLLRMDQVAQMKMLAEGVKGGIYMPDEARAKVNLPAVPGGDAVYLQQQNYSTAALAKRDAKEDPFATAPKESPAPAPKADDDDMDDEDTVTLLALFTDGLNTTAPVAAPVPTLLLDVDSQIRASVGIVTALAANVAESQKRVDATLDVVVASARHQEQLTERVVKSTEDLSATLKMPVVPIYDKDGMLKGSRRVEKLDDA